EGARSTEGHHQDGTGQRLETEILVNHGEVLFVFFVDQAWSSYRNRYATAKRFATFFRPLLLRPSLMRIRWPA
ncbi:hypothetical protein, partial [Xanthomonas fragariae]|uniref:hypothetical protein n=1 Tax=Xanthomonas fragariae TaxID=48664 RepID=UPI001F1CE647